LISATFAVVELLEAMVLEGEDFAQWIVGEPIWPFVLILSGAVYLIVRTIKKRTNWLKVRGR
jgi:hypothetical protein